MLLPDNRLLTVPSPDLCIYDLSLVPWSSEERPVCVDMSVPERRSCSVTVPGTSVQHPCGFSKVFHLPDNEYRVVFNTLAGIRGLIVRYAETGSLEASAVELIHWREKMDKYIREFRSDFSYNYGVARSESGLLLRVRFSWPDEESSFESGTSLILDETNEMPLVMNMEVAAGRLAWIAAESGRVAMLDF